MLQSEKYFPLLKTVLLRRGLILFAILFFQTTFEQLITFKMQALLMDASGTGPSLYFWGLASMLNSLIFPTLSVVLIVSAVSSGSRRFLEHLNQTLIETLRSWGSVLTWSLALILPGFYRWLRLIFVPFVVILLPEYEKGDLDALDASSELTQGQLLRVLGVLFLGFIIIPLFLNAFEEYRIVWQTPLPSLLLTVVDTLIMIVFTVWLLRIFLQLSLRKKVL